MRIFITTLGAALSGGAIVILNVELLDAAYTVYDACFFGIFGAALLLCAALWNERGRRV